MLNMLFADPATWSPMLLAVIVVISIWDAVWKGIGMWHAARGKQLPWFIAIFLINSVGILPIIYMYFFRKKR